MGTWFCFFLFKAHKRRPCFYILSYFWVFSLPPSKLPEQENKNRVLLNPKLAGMLSPVFTVYILLNETKGSLGVIQNHSMQQKCSTVA